MDFWTLININCDISRQVSMRDDTIDALATVKGCQVFVAKAK